MKLPFLSNNKHSKPSSLWRWPSCNQAETHSFHNTAFKTINSAYIDTHTHNDDDSFLFTSSSPSGLSPSIATTMIAEKEEEEYGSGDSLEKMIRDIRSEKTERLFFEAGKTNSILEQGTNKVSISGFPLVVSMESQDPLLDFKKSMEEMVEANGVKDLNGLEELLNCYLRVNEKSNHEYIVGAFIDLLVSLDFDSSSNHCNGGASRSPFSIPTSSSNGDSSLTTCISSMELESVINREKDE